MLPINRWPEFLYRVVWAVIAPHRAAQDFRRRIDRQWAINRELNLEVQELKSALDSQKRDTTQLLLDLNSDVAAEHRKLTEQLQAEQSRHRETALNLELEVGRIKVLSDQMQVLVTWREAELRRMEAEARIQELRGRGKQGEE